MKRWTTCRSSSLEARNVPRVVVAMVMTVVMVLVRAVMVLIAGHVLKQHLLKSVPD